ncbi:hypothetical protein [Pseudomonas purpurea]|uniref:hypothetical protein n=1 Tax=Pseudomonas purpurea TaxID=3136737 RepID=UPI003265D9C1
MNRNDPLEHFWNIFFLAIGCFFKVVFLQALVLSLLFGGFFADGQDSIYLGLMSFVVFAVSGMFFGVVPMSLGFAPLYALLSAKGYANWLTAILASLIVAGVLCLYPSLRKLGVFWVVDGILVALFTHWAYQRWLKLTGTGAPTLDEQPTPP